MRKNKKRKNFIAMSDGTLIEAPRGIRLTDRVTRHKNIVYVERTGGDCSICTLIEVGKY